MRKLTDAEQVQIKGAIRELDAIGPGGTASADVWTRLRDLGLQLRDSLDGRPPSLPELRLVAAAERIAVWHPPRPALEDVANDSQTREQIILWKRRLAEARAQAAAAQTALEAGRAAIVAKLRKRAEEEAVVSRYPPAAFVLIDEVVAEREGLRPLEREALLALVASNELARAFGDWRLRAWCDGKLRSRKGT